MCRRQPIFDSLDLLPDDQRTAALERIISDDDVQAALEESGRAGRHCPRLPLDFVVWFVLALNLFSKDNYREVFKRLQRFRLGATPSRGTLCDARQALGLMPLRRLSRRAVGLLGSPDTPGAFYKGMRLMGLDGFVLDVADSPANDKAFGRPHSGRSEGAFPQVRVVALCETGSHVLYRWQVKTIRRGESSMVPYLLRWLEADMLLLWDRNFPSFKNVKAVRDRNANLLARLKSGPVFEPSEVLPDGSYLSKIYPSPSARKQGKGGLVVRIIEYTLNDPGRPSKEKGKVQRLLTTLLDAEKYPAEELIVKYHERWEEELAIDELKTHQKERPVLRSQTPVGVLQEVEGLLLAHYAIRVVMQESAEALGLDPDRLSFTGALRILRCRLAEVPADEAGRRRWWEDLLAEVSEEILPERRDRVNPRVIKRKMSKWAKKRPQHRRIPQPTMPFAECIKIE